MPKIKKETIALKDAIFDLEKEIVNLRKEKAEFDKKVKRAGSDIVGTQVEEENLRNKISRLVAKEGVLQKKRGKLKEKLDSTEEKISKVRHIKEELTEIEGEE